MVKCACALKNRACVCTWYRSGNPLFFTNHGITRQGKRSERIHSFLAKVHCFLYAHIDFLALRTFKQAANFEVALCPSYLISYLIILLIDLYQKMVDRAIKVSVLEGDFASLSAIGFPLPLCIQLQLGQLKLEEAMWTAKFTSGGFSVNFFWPTPAPEKIVKTKSKKKRRKKKPKASNNVTMAPSQPLSSQMTTVVPENLPAAKHVVPLDAPQHDSKVSPLISSNSPQSQATNTSSPASVLSPSHSKSLDLENCLL